MNQFLVIHGSTAMSLFEKGASSSALRVFMVLCLYANIHDSTCFPSIGTLQEATQLGERTVRDALDWLVANEFISRDRVYTDAGRQTSNTYTVHNKGAVDRRGEGAEFRTPEGAVDRTPILKRISNERESEVNITPCIPLKGNERKPSSGKFQPPSDSECKAYAAEIELPVSEAEAFLDHFTTNGWRTGRGGIPMKDWKAAMRTWKRNAPKFDLAPATVRRDIFGRVIA